MILSLLATAVTGCLGSCSVPGDTDGDSSAVSGTDTVDIVPEVKITLDDGTQALISGGFRLDFKKTDSGYGIYVVDAENDGAVMYENDKPAMISVRGKGQDQFDEYDFSAAYSSVADTDKGYTALATVKTTGGSEFLFEDNYCIADTGAFVMSRKVKVSSAAEEDMGFRSLYSLDDPNGAVSVTGHEFFIPGILYKDSQDMVSHAIGADLDVDRMYVKETRTGLPLAMLRSSDNKYSVAVAHLNPSIDVGDNIGGGAHGDVNIDLQYGSVGYTVKKGLSVDFCYPSFEGPVVYYAKTDAKGVFHPVSTGIEHEYSLSVIPAKEETYADSMTYTYQKAYMTESPKIAEGVDIKAVYDYNIDVFTKTYHEFGTGDVIAAGVPWSINLDNGRVVEYTFQMGFVGQQTSVGYNLMRAG